VCPYVQIGGKVCPPIAIRKSCFVASRLELNTIDGGDLAENAARSILWLEWMDCMLTSDDFFQWCQHLNLSQQAQTVLEQIRSSPPTRRVGSGGKNVPVRYPSRKMGVVVQAESSKNELAGVYEMEHDPAVLEYFDQPPSITLRYQAKNGRPIGVLHTPDFFVIRQDAAGWEEWKMEEELLRLAGKMPHRYVHGDNGQWHCPPGEQIAEPLGLYYRVRSSASIHWVVQRNLRFLAYYLRADCPAISNQACEEVLSWVESEPGIILNTLLKRIEGANSDDIYTLLATEQIYADLHTVPLAEADRVHLFRDEATAQAWAVVLAQAQPLRLEQPHTIRAESGTPVVWDGKPCTFLYQGQTTTTLLTEDQLPLELSNAHFQALIATGKLIGLREASDHEEVQTQIRERFKQAGTAALLEASRRYTAIKPVLDGEATTPNTSEGRKLRRWVASYRAAEHTLGCGYVGLLSRSHHSGNRQPRLTEKTVELLQEFITNEYEQHKQKNKREVYGELVSFCQRKGLPTPPSYKTVVAAINRRPRYEQVKQRKGTRAAYAYEPLHWELAYTLPRHGDRPFEIVHIDHTLLDVELIDSQTYQHVGKPWATFLMDAFSRRLLAVSLTFDEPSYRSCMMVLRECVHRYHRFPELVVVDWGPEFGSVYFETLLARYECSKASRPKAKPRFGSVVERLFNTANSTFVHNLEGNTQVMKDVRQITRSVDPCEHAIWTLGELYEQLRRWTYEVYDMTEHQSLMGQSPKEAFEAGLLQSGFRPKQWIPYDEDFIMFTLPSTRKGTAKLQPNVGVKINSRYYWAKGDIFRDDPALEKTQIPVRYDPYDMGHAFAFVKGEWVECISEHYASFQGRTEREIQSATEELRQRHRLHGQHFTVTAARLADFITSVEAREALFVQRRRDSEAKAIVALMEGTTMQGPEAKALGSPLPARAEPLAPPGADQEPTRCSMGATDDICADY